MVQLVGTFGVLTLAGAMMMLFGVNRLSAGRVGHGRNRSAYQLAGYKLAGSYYARMGQVIVGVGLLGAAVSVFIGIVFDLGH